MSQQAPSDRMIGIVMLASLIAGLIAGITARIIMRIVALTARLLLQFTFTGTFIIVFIGFFIEFIVGWIYAVCLFFLNSSTKVGKYLPGPIWRGLAFGALLLVILGLPCVLIPFLLPKEDLRLGIPLLNKSMFAALPLIYGLTLGGAEAILDRSLPGNPASSEGENKSPTV